MVLTVLTRLNSLPSCVRVYCKVDFLDKRVQGGKRTVQKTDFLHPKHDWWAWERWGGSGMDNNKKM